MNQNVELIIEEIESETRHILDGATAGVTYRKRVDEVLKTLEERPLTKDEVLKLKLMIYCMRVQEGRAHIMASIQFMRTVNEELLHSNLKVEKEILHDGIQGMERVELKHFGTGATLSECYENMEPLDAMQPDAEPPYTPSAVV